MTWTLQKHLGSFGTRCDFFRALDFHKPLLLQLSFLSDHVFIQVSCDSLQKDSCEGFDL